MSALHFKFCGQSLEARGSGAMYWPAQELLCVSDLHLGKSARAARRLGVQLPPYDVCDTLERLQAEINATNPRILLCLGDSFDDLTASREISAEAVAHIRAMQAGRRWIWIEGNHDPGPTAMGGEHLAQLTLAGLVFRHIAEPETWGEVSGHYHPKAPVRTRLRVLTRPCFLVDRRRIVLPAFGTFTGGLRSDSEVLCGLMQEDACAIVTGQVPYAVPMPRDIAYGKSGIVPKGRIE